MALFDGKRIRKALHKGEWWFSVIDVIEILTASDRPRKYWNDLKKKLTQEGYSEVSEKIGQLITRIEVNLEQRAELLQLFMIR